MLQKFGILYFGIWDLIDFIFEKAD